MWSLIGFRDKKKRKIERKKRKALNRHLRWTRYKTHDIIHNRACQFHNFYRLSRRFLRIISRILSITRNAYARSHTRCTVVSFCSPVDETTWIQSTYEKCIYKPIKQHVIAWSLSQAPSFHLSAVILMCCWGKSNKIKNKTKSSPAVYGNAKYATSSLFPLELINFMTRQTTFIIFYQNRSTRDICKVPHRS